jgi:hypothetical protein
MNRTFANSCGLFQQLPDMTEYNHEESATALAEVQIRYVIDATISFMH